MIGMQRAIGTTLLVITLVSISGTASHLFTGRELPLDDALVFTLGSVAGLFASSSLGAKLSGLTLQRTFAAAIVLVLAYRCWFAPSGRDRA